MGPGGSPTEPGWGGPARGPRERPAALRFPASKARLKWAPRSGPWVVFAFLDMVEVGGSTLLPPLYKSDKDFDSDYDTVELKGNVAGYENTGEKKNNKVWLLKVGCFF